MDNQNKMWLKVWGVLLVVFALGCVTGASLIGLYRSEVTAPPSPMSLSDGDVYFDTLQRELNLDSRQATAMRAILDETRNHYKSVCAEVRPRYDSLRAHARGRMRSLLSPDQQQRFDAIVTQEDCRCPELKK